MDKTQSLYDRIAALFFGAVGAFFALYACTIDIGAWNEPGPGFLPFWAGLTLALMSAALFVRQRGRRGPPRPSFFTEAGSWKRVAATFLSLIGYNLALDFLGFTVTTFFFVFLLVRFIFPQSWLRSLIVATSAAAVARLLFINLLQTQLPKGVFGL